MDKYRVLAVDDDSIALEIVSAALATTCAVHLCTNAEEALRELGRQEQVYDLVVTDIGMPVMDGIELVDRIRRIEHMPLTPIIVLTGRSDQSSRSRALMAGATDFLRKPVDAQELRIRAGNLCELNRSRRMLQMHAENLETKVRQAVVELSDREEEMIFRLSLAVEQRDYATGNHLKRVSSYASEIAKNIGIEAKTVSDIALASHLHDIGKVSIPDDILLKRGPLDDEERGIMQRHALAGFKILSGSKSALIQLAADIAYCHHERFSGGGYPRGISGRDIPIAARIVSVADVFDALTTKRPYKEAWSFDDAFAEIETASGSQFDPECVGAFMRQRTRIIEIATEFSD